VLLAVYFRRTAQPVDARFFHFLAPSAHDEVPHQRPSPFPYYRSSLETHRFVHTLIPTTDNILRLFCRSVFIVNNNRFFFYLILLHIRSRPLCIHITKSVSQPAFCFVFVFSKRITTFEFRFSLHDEIVLLNWLFGCSGRHRRWYFQFKKTFEFVLKIS
jgi:hypothetical protein